MIRGGRLSSDSTLWWHLGWGFNRSLDRRLLNRRGGFSGKFTPPRMAISGLAWVALVWSGIFRNDWMQICLWFQR